MKILHMTLKKKWFDLIACGKKTVEYREDKPYWRKRLLDNGIPKIFDEVHFRNGYGKNSPIVRVEYLSAIAVIDGPGMAEHGEVLGHRTLAISLGKVIHVSSKGDLA